MFVVMDQVVKSSRRRFERLNDVFVEDVIRLFLGLPGRGRTALMRKYCCIIGVCSVFDDLVIKESRVGPFNLRNFSSRL